MAHDVCTSSVTGREIRAGFTLLFWDFEWDIHVVVREYFREQLNGALIAIFPRYEIAGPRVKRPSTVKR